MISLVDKNYFHDVKSLRNDSVLWPKSSIESNFQKVDMLWCPPKAVTNGDGKL